MVRVGWFLPCYFSLVEHGLSWFWFGSTHPMPSVRIFGLFVCVLKKEHFWNPLILWGPILRHTHPWF